MNPPARATALPAAPILDLRGRAVLLALAILALSACGGGGGGGSGSSSFAIVTQALPTAGLDVPYSTGLEAEGGTTPYAWRVATGSSLPPGLALSLGGTISGTPTQSGTFAFDVEVTDAAASPKTETASYVLGVSPFGAAIASLEWGDAWTGDSYPLSAVGASSVTFQVVVNASGASIEDADPDAGTATYVAGPNPGLDRIRATSDGGATQDIDVTVVRDPTENLVARFSTTDVWHVRFTGKKNAGHSFANDFDQSLAVLGLRAPSSLDALGTTADQIAWTWVRQRTLNWLNAYYLNAQDGTPLASGLEVSFPFDAPLAPHFHPADGVVANASFNQYNVISCVHGNTAGVLGTAYLDEPDNDSQENDTTTSQTGDLGVFTDELAAYVNLAYSNDTLPDAPVGASDVARLKALLYGTTVVGDPRYDEIRRIGEGFARTLAAVCAHEVGHSLSLDHTSPTQSGSIMNASAMIGPTATYAFVAADVDALRVALPGPNRGGVPQLAPQIPVWRGGWPFGRDVSFETLESDEGVLLGAPKARCGSGSCVLHRRAAR